MATTFAQLSELLQDHVYRWRNIDQCSGAVLSNHQCVAELNGLL